MSAKQQPRSKRPTLNAKNAALNEIILRNRNAARRENDVLGRVAANLIAPGEAEMVVFPGLGRRGVARYRIVRTVSSATSFGVRCRPSTVDPLCLTADAVQPVGLRIVNGSGLIEAKASRVDMKQHICDDYVVLARTTVANPDYVALPLTTNVSSNLTIRLSSNSQVPAAIDLLAWDGAAWVTPALWTTQTVGENHPPASTTVTWAVTYTDYRFLVAPVASGSNNYSGNLCWQFEGNCSCAPVLEDCSMTSIPPEWDAVKAVSEEISVVAMSMLITYKGSSLNNTGSIAGAYVEDEELDFDSSMYDTLAERPFDRYEGRLAPAGGEEGGIHIHYVPTDFSQLLLGDTEQKDLPNLYAGITGKTAGEAVRIQVDLTINFYTTDPSYVMQIAPPVDGMLALFSHMRHAVPIVTSNDSHVKKLAKFLKKGKSMYDLSKDGFDKLTTSYPQEIALLAEMMKLLI